MSLKTIPLQTYLVCLLTQISGFQLAAKPVVAITWTVVTFIYWPLRAYKTFQCVKSPSATHTQKFPAWILIQFTKKKEVEKRVSRLDCSKSTFIQSDYIINWLPNSFYSGLFQTHATVLDERPATCPDCHFTILKLAALLVLLWGQVHHLEPDR